MADGRRTLTWLHPSLLPEALARLVDLGPRPRVMRAEPLRLSTTSLDRLLEVGRAGAAGGESEPLDAVAAELSLASGLRRRWRLSSAWTLDAGGSRGGTLEAIDTDGGVWLLEGEGERLVAWPVTPTVIWRLIVNLVMRRAGHASAATSPF